ncbi:AbiU2 domain-containing protein [Sphingobacterium lactis]|uniref:HEPN AbiU2-like domain-containing protein n=1 Tax=Sphingobacterium lactis TaxID=797291 RepID=A0A1H6BQT3_9SPHI|nr:hypothetical protein [Sphingobacterium lactis]SEG62815.1 hypothetical protein SAMN05421877_11154 [Sphingobacterium lactis]
MTIKDYSELVLGINRIVFEAKHNYSAFCGIYYNDNFNVSLPIPTALLMLMKNHYHVYVMEISKLLSSGDNHFNINKALNGIRQNEKYREEAQQVKNEINMLKPAIDSIRATRNNIFAHLDQNYYNFKNSLTETQNSELNNVIFKAVDFLNSTLQLPEYVDYRKMQSPDSIAFYNLIFTELINTGKADNLPKQDAKVLY